MRVLLFFMLSIQRGHAGLSPSGVWVAYHLRRGGSGYGLSEPRFAHSFYKSSAWMKCAKAYRNDRGGLCERCWAKGLIVPGEEVHHKIKLTPENINDPAIALNWDNLEPLCDACHKAEHKPTTRWRCDALGHVEL